MTMNAVLEACVHCSDIDSALKVFDEMIKPHGCGVDTVTYGTLLKVLTKRFFFFRCLNLLFRILGELDFLILSFQLEGLFFFFFPIMLILFKFNEGFGEGAKN